MKESGKWILVLAVLIGIFLWHPVCVPIEDANAANLEQRIGERMWGVQTFRKKDGHWYQCKPWLARQMFF